MKLSKLKLLLACALLATAASKADDHVLRSHTDRSAAAPGIFERWSDRALARMQGWMTRARHKINGRDDDSMHGCGGMMGGMGMMRDGGDMMGGMGNMQNAQPNEQWRKPVQQSPGGTPNP